MFWKYNAGAGLYRVTKNDTIYNVPRKGMSSDQPSKGVLSMKGKVKTRETCSCGQKFGEVIERIGRQAESIWKCPVCGLRPKTFFILWYHPIELKNRAGEFVWTKNHRISRHPDDGLMLTDNIRANRLLNRMRDEEDNGTFDISNYIQPEIAKFDGQRLLLLWYRSKSKKWAPSYRTEIRRYIRTYYAPIGVMVLKNRDCRDIRSHHIEDFTRRLPNVSEKTKENIMSPLSDFCKWLKGIRGVLKEMPLFPKFNPPRPKKGWITEAVRSAIISHMHPHDQILFNFWKKHPVRNGELRVIRARHFDSYLCETETGLVRVWGISVEDAISEKKIQHRKNKEPYVMPLDPSFDWSILKGKSADDFAFRNRFGRPYTQSMLEHAWKDAQALFNKQMQAEGRDLVISIRVYWAMRRSTATHLRLFKKAQLDDIRRLLGQRQTASTNEYADVDNLYLGEVLHGTQLVHNDVIAEKEGDKTEDKSTTCGEEMERVAGLETVQPASGKDIKSKG